MKKISDLFHQFQEHLPSWITPPVIGIFILVSVFLIAAVLSEVTLQTHAIQVTRTSSNPAATPISKSKATQVILPPEWLENRDQTIGIVIAGTFLVMIIVGGTLGAITRRNNR